VAAVSCGGIEAVKDGSIKAILGARVGDLTVNLKFSAVSVMTELKVTSLPVPAVVGMVKIGRRSPRIFVLSSYVLTGPPRAAVTETAFAQSMGLPPPMAMRAPAPDGYEGSRFAGGRLLRRFFYIAVFGIRFNPVIDGYRCSAGGKR
jgi:hypothetical protein